MKNVLAVCLAAAMILSLCACGSAAGSTAPASAPAASGAPAAAPAASGEKTYKEAHIVLGHVLAVDSPGDQAAKWFAEEMSKRSGGKMVVEIYSGSELGSDREMIEAAGIGAIDMCIPGPSPMTPFDARMAAFNLPFFFGSLEEAQAVIDSDYVKPIFESFTKNSNVMCLANWENGFRQLSTREKQVTRLDDLRSLKIRIPQSEFFTNMWDQMGCTGVSTAWSELYTSLQTGVCDGAECPIANYYATGFGEVTKYFTFTNYVYDPLILCCGVPFFEKLDADQQALLKEVALDAGAFQRNLLNEYEASLQEKLEKEHGIVFNELSDEAHQEFVDVLKPLYDSYAYQDDIKAIRDAKAALGY